ncbi:restriction endonuclease subunit S [Mycoplasma suis]|uniref:restriction endonuclease subunit S n=1 Tax=Mycoplasma suis TaxID=57372 RepID=UPI0002DB0405|nr:restriction endonuclease subunit S [Mycoplasma suis]
MPPQEEQERIGDTLSAYDELIENNERQIEVLQGVRTAIFKEWFINLRFPNYLTYETERERERESRLPDSWQYQKIEEIAIFKKGKKSIKTENKNGKYPFFSSSGKSFFKSDEYSCDEDAILVTDTGKFILNLYRGKFEATPECFIISSKENKFFYLLAETIKSNLKILENTAVVTIAKRLRLPKLLELIVIIPCDKILEKFNNICENIQLKIENLQKNIERLEKIKNDLFKMIFSRKISIN